jgi:hypothetical protein
MPIATRTFRVFVSSTFEGLRVERDALQRDVFPELRTLCEQHGARFLAIDLRLGIHDEAALDQIKRPWRSAWARSGAAKQPSSQDAPKALTRLDLHIPHQHQPVLCLAQHDFVHLLE